MIKKYKSIILYLFFGVCTTFINIIVYIISDRGLKTNTIISTIIAWIISVFFAYITNRIWVFESSAPNIQAVCFEAAQFVLCRLLTGVLDVFLMFFGVDIIGINDILMKIFSNVLVVIINYIASKLIIFKKR